MHQNPKDTIKIIAWWRSTANDVEDNFNTTNNTYPVAAVDRSRLSSPASNLRRMCQAIESNANRTLIEETLRSAALGSVAGQCRSPA